MQRLLELTTQPITTEPNTTADEWAGTTLQRLVRTPHRIAEWWPFFSGPQRPARIAGTEAAGGITMEELIARVPHVLGPAGADPEHAHQKYFFVKFLDPSDFPPFAYVGFNPKTIGTLGKTRAAQLATFTALLWEDRLTVQRLADLVRPKVFSHAVFEAFKTAYKQWAIAQASADWADPRTGRELDRFVTVPQREAARTILRSQRDIRRRITAALHRINFQPDEAILIESPTLHAIAGLSLQVHPRAPSAFYPKDEVWLYQEIVFPPGERKWILVEPQRTFDRTDSGADFFTPFAWFEAGGAGRLGFRKMISQPSLQSFSRFIDATPHPVSHYLRRAKPLRDPALPTRGQARWHRIVEEPTWPSFVARELRWSGPGHSTLRLEHHCFIELHVTQGDVEVELTNRTGNSYRFRVSPPRPAFLPATLPYETITYRARGAARLHWFSRPSAAPARRPRVRHPRRPRGPGRP